MNLSELNPKQKEAAEHPEGPLLIVAGAGSGKTRTLTNRLFQLIKNGAAPENIIAITFTNKAADEMRDRVDKLIKLEADKSQPKNPPFVGTFHSLGARILRKEARFLNRRANYTIYDEDDSMRLVKKIAKNFNLDSKKFPPPQLRYKFSSIKNELLDLNDFPQARNSFDSVVGLTFQEYEKQLEENNAFDFDDLIEKVVFLFKNHSEILEKYQKQFKYILVDEYQDINTAQYEFIRLLAEAHNNLSVVGDDQQSIYRFRHSDFRNFLNFERDWPKAKVVLLEQNYRSTSNIIKAASSVIANNKFQRPKNLWTENEEGDPVKVVEHENHWAEAEFISTLVKSKLSLSVKPPRVAILYRTNAQSRAIEQAFLERGISYRIFGGPGFYERKEIKDLMAALRYAYNPADSVSLERLDKNFYKKVYLELKENLPQKAKELLPAQLIAYVVEKTDFFRQLEKEHINFKERRENVDELVSFAADFSDLAIFLEKTSLRGPLTGEPEAPRVSLMTIHLSKGLEFDDVFLIGVNEGLLPHQMSYGTEEEIEEERRLIYVAMTRAMKNLYLNFYDLPSRFLSEISPETIEYLGSARAMDDEERYIEY